MAAETGETKARHGLPWITSRALPLLAKRPANSAAINASRYVARARLGSTASSSRAALSSSGGASLPRLAANAIWARSRCTRARSRSSRVPVSAVASSATASSSAPASNLVCAAASARCARRDGSGVSATARSRNAAAAARPAPRLSPAGRPLELARRRPHRDRPPPRQGARRDGRDRPARRSPLASARCTCRRSFGVAAR